MVAVTKHGAGGDPAGPLGRFPRTTAFIDELISLRVGGDAGVARLREARRWAAQAERRQSLSQTVAKNIRAVASSSIIRMPHVKSLFADADVTGVGGGGGVNGGFMSMSSMMALNA